MEPSEMHPDAVKVELGMMEDTLANAKKTGREAELLADTEFCNKLQRLRMQQMENELKLKISGEYMIGSAVKSFAEAIAKTGCSCGCLPVVIGIIGAASMSWVCNHSVAWMIFHGCLNWLYLTYQVPWWIMNNY